MAPPSTSDSALTLALENQTRSLLAELDKRIQSMDSKWESRVSVLENTATDAARSVTEFSTALRADVEAHLTASDAATEGRLHHFEVETGNRIAALESAMQMFDFWRPRVDSSIDSLQSNMDWMRAEIAKMDAQWSHGARVGGATMPGVLGSPGSLAASPSILGTPGAFASTGSGPGHPPAAVDYTDGPRFGHGFDSYLRDSGLRHPTADGRYPVTEEMVWVKVATMYFEGAAGRWLQSVEPRLPSLSWTSTVQDYVDRFSELVDLLEEAEASRPREVRRGDAHLSYKTPTKTSSYQDWDKHSPQASDRPTSMVSDPSSSDSKVASLRAYRRARGLCQYCADKWVKGHKCSPTIQLHVMQELWDLLTPESQEPEAEFQDTSEQFMILLSTEAVSSKSSRSTFRLSGSLFGQELLMLLDSGSSHCFLNTSLASSLTGVNQLAQPLSVTVANGNKLQCTAELTNAEWTCQGLSFTSSFKLLPIPCYDAIIGMDWLESCSPMYVDWKHKWISLSHLGKSALLQGVQPTTPSASLLELRHTAPDQSEIFQLQIAHDSSVPEAIQHLLHEFDFLFAEPKSLPPSRFCDHHIPLIAGARPVNIRPYRFSPTMKDEIETQVADMLRQGLIQHSSSSFSSPVLLVRKKDNTWRFCVDYRHLNALTVKSKYPVPIIDELLDELFGASYFSILDLRAGFHQVLLKAGEEHKTAFQTHMGHYKFRVMAFGLTGAPGTFQRAMNHTLSPLLRKCALVFFDDILVYSDSLESHVQHLHQVFSLLAQDQWKVKRSKCSFAQSSVSYLGHVVSKDGVATDPGKIQLLKKGVHFIWTSEHDTAFSTLKQALTSAPVLSLPDFASPFTVETDASAVGIGAVLMQHGHPVAFLSKALGPKTRGLSTYEKEYMAIIVAVQQWRSYLQHGEFTILTDHKSLTQLNEQRLHTPWQHKVFTKLLGLNYRIQYRSGSDNRAADALSRHSFAECQAVSVIVPQWLVAVQDSYHQDKQALSLISKLAVDPAAVPNFTLHDGLLRYKERIWVGEDTHLQHRIVEALHSSPLGGHSGIPVTYSRVKKLFAWTKLKPFVQKFVQECQVSKGWLLPRFHHPCRSSAFLSEYSRLEDYPRATGWFSRSWWNGLASRLTSLHGKIKKLFVKAFLWPLLGDKQASKGQGMLPTRQWRRCPSRYNSKMAQYRMVQASRMRQLVVCVGPTGAYMGPSGCRPAGTQRLACV
eukprot:XP_020407373.1 uncharacterized protein LOC103652751 [Zea mays]